MTLLVGLLVVAVGSFAPWFTERTFAGAGEISGVHHGGWVTLGCAVSSLPLVMIWPRAVIVTMTIACAWAVLAGYTVPGLLASSRGGEVDVTWGLVLVVVAAVLTAGLALVSDDGRQARTSQ